MAASADAYQMKIYGDVDDVASPANYRTLEVNAPWITYNVAKTVQVTGGDGLKTIRVKIRDNVGNETAELTDTITLDTTAPVVTVTAGPTPATISKVATFRNSTFSFTVDTAIQAWEARVVAAAGDLRGAGSLIPTTNGSVSQGGAAGSGATVNGSIDGRDLELASAGDTTKRVKIFAQDQAGNWSVV